LLGVGAEVEGGTVDTSYSLDTARKILAED